MTLDFLAVPFGQYIPTPFASESITISSTALPLTAATYDPATSEYRAVQAFITCETDAVVYWLDGTTPTASSGHVLASGGNLTLSRSCIQRAKFIRQTNDATLRVTYFRAAEA